ncbi:sulfotransferase [Neiella marina]|uniref:Sulfotransferase n=1 Tax=Neiella holothuriorum TaxID=2870530 RepID=A0ABS7EHM9_9GAMM|nr:sulfotransferase [Neiella holothuriorum]MBW8191856.1 sulfotransferase [Neiella holothuriorum]
MPQFLQIFWLSGNPVTSMPSVEQLHKAAQQALNQQNFKAAHQYCLQILQQQPQHADSYFLLGMIAAAMGQMNKSLQLVEQALALVSNNAEYQAQHAKILALLNHPSEATASAEKAQQLVSASDAVTLDTIGVVYSRLGQHRQAADLFEKVCQLRPNQASYWFNLAASARFNGNFEQARHAYEKVIALQPHHYAAHSSLSDLGDLSEQQNHIERLLKTRAACQSVDGQVHLGHALLKEYEALGQYPAAFDALTQGNQQKKQQLNYQSQDDQALFDAVIAAFEQQQEAVAQGYNTAEPIFITGMPRSGTTLVDRIISSHSKVMTAGELQNFGIELKRASATPSNRVLDPQTIAQASSLDPALIGERYLQSTRPQTGQTPHFTDKMPLNFFYLGLIARALPSAKLIWLDRNPMDTCVSNFRQLFALNFSYYNYSYDLLDTGRFYLQFRRLMNFWQQQLGDRLLRVHYESLVANPETEIRRILAHCELEFEPQCIDFHLNESPVSTASAVQVRQPINSRSIGRWKRYEQQTQALQQLLQQHQIIVD